MNGTKLILFIFLFVAFGEEEKREGRTFLTIPNPREEPEECMSEEGVMFCDPLNVMGEKWLKEFKMLQEKLEKETEEKNEGPCSLYEVGIVAVNGLAETGEEEVEGICQRVLSSWQLGDESCQNGALVLFSLKDKLFHLCEVGWSQRRKF